MAETQDAPIKKIAPEQILAGRVSIPDISQPDDEKKLVADLKKQPGDIGSSFAAFQLGELRAEGTSLPPEYTEKIDFSIPIRRAEDVHILRASNDKLFTDPYVVASFPERQFPQEEREGLEQFLDAGSHTQVLHLFREVIGQYNRAQIGQMRRITGQRVSSVRRDFGERDEVSDDEVVRFMRTMYQSESLRWEEIMRRDRLHITPDRLKQDEGARQETYQWAEALEYGVRHGLVGNIRLKELTQQMRLDLEHTRASYQVPDERIPQTEETQVLSKQMIEDLTLQIRGVDNVSARTT